MKKRIFVGPVTNAPSFEWVLSDVIAEIQAGPSDYEFHYFTEEDGIADDCDIAIFSKSLPSFTTLFRLRKKHILFIPIDHYYSKFQIWSDKALLRQLDGMLLHSRHLSPFLPAGIPQYAIDHYDKYKMVRADVINSKLLWIGVSEYLADTVEYLTKAGIGSDDILLLSDIKNARENQRRINGQLSQKGLPELEIIDDETARVGSYIIEKWSPERQELELSRCKACIDVKNAGFRHNTKPPTKCQIHASSGIPQFVNSQHPALSLLEKDNISLKTIDAISDMSAEDIAAYGESLKSQCANRYHLDNVASSYLQIFNAVLAKKPNSRRLLLAPMFVYKFSNFLFENLSSGSAFRNKLSAILRR